MNKTYLKTLLAALAICALSQAQAADFTNSIGMQFITIPAGIFYMDNCKPGSTCPSGAEADTEAYADETPQHRVSIAQAFQLEG